MNIEIETHAFVDPLLFSFEKMEIGKNWKFWYKTSH